MFGDFPDITDILSWKVLLVIVAICVLRQYLKGHQFPGHENAKTKIAVITGGSCGIGKQVIRELCYRGIKKIYVGCRDMAKAQDGLAHLVRMGCNPQSIELVNLDLANFSSVRDFVTHIKAATDHVDLLINNAGIMMYPRYHLTVDNHEIQWQTNFLGPVLLTELLLPLLKASGTETRIVNVTCLAHKAAVIKPEVHLTDNGVDRKQNYESRDQFSRSKLALLMYSRELSRVLRQEGSSVTVNACHPGICFTSQFRYTPMQSNAILKYSLAPFAWFLMKTPKDGAQTVLFCALAMKLSGMSGKYFSDCGEAKPSDEALKNEVCNEVYQYSRRVLAL